MQSINELSLLASQKGVLFKNQYYLPNLHNCLETSMLCMEGFVLGSFAIM